MCIFLRVWGQVRVSLRGRDFDRSRKDTKINTIRSNSSFFFFLWVDVNFAGGGNERIFRGDTGRE